MPQEKIELALPEELEEVPDEPLSNEQLEGIGRSPRTFIMTPKVYEWLRSLGLEHDQDLREILEYKYKETSVQLSYNKARSIVETYVRNLERVSRTHVGEETENEYLPPPRPQPFRSLPAHSLRVSEDRVAHIECPCGREYWMS